MLNFEISGRFRCGLRVPTHFFCFVLFCFVVREEWRATEESGWRMRKGGGWRMRLRIMLMGRRGMIIKKRNVKDLVNSFLFEKKRTRAPNSNKSPPFLPPVLPLLVLLPPLHPLLPPLLLLLLLHVPPTNVLSLALTPALNPLPPLPLNGLVLPTKSSLLLDNTLVLPDLPFLPLPILLLFLLRLFLLLLLLEGDLDLPLLPLFFCVPLNLNTLIFLASSKRMIKK